MTSGIVEGSFGTPVCLPVVRGVDAVLLALGVTLALLARRLRRPASSASSRTLVPHGEPADVT